MATFLTAVEALLEIEKGYVVDHAGPTNWGVTLATLRRQGDLDHDGWEDGDIDHDGDVDADDVRALPRERAIEVYRNQWWDRYGYGRIRSDRVAAKVLDMSVNMGSATAHRAVQIAVSACGHPAEIDGVFGPQTLAALNATHECFSLVALRATAGARYVAIVAGNATKYGKYLTGWLRRAWA